MPCYMHKPVLVSMSQCNRAAYLNWFSSRLSQFNSRCVPKLVLVSSSQLNSRCVHKLVLVSSSQFNSRCVRKLVLVSSSQSNSRCVHKLVLVSSSQFNSRCVHKLVLVSSSQFNSRCVHKLVCPCPSPTRSHPPSVTTFRYDGCDASTVAKTKAGPLISAERAKTKAEHSRCHLQLN